MAEQQPYLSIGAPSAAELVEKKSRFIGQAAPATSEQQAQAFIEQVRAKYRDASHHVYAMQIGPQDQIQRSNDAGEPAGTAGRPTLEAIKNADLHNLVVVVTRYFGGTLLGAGGLTRAYGKTAQLALQAAPWVLVTPGLLCALHFDYGLLGRIEALVAEQAYTVRDKSYQENVCFLLEVPLAEIEPLRANLQDLSAGALRFQQLGEEIELRRPCE